MASLVARYLVFSTLIPSLALARDVPDKLKSFYDHVRDQGQCDNVLAGGFHSTDNDSGDFEYCGDWLDDYKIVYLQGKDGQLVNMDIDCDGAQKGVGDDGRCGSSDDTQFQTSFMEDLQSYKTNQTDLNANIHTYVVFGNEGTKKGWPTFKPQDYGIEPLSVMAVVCGDKLVYGVWGDTNGDDMPEAMVGEASISLATACYGTRINGNSGHDDNDVLFIAFTGTDAVPGAEADWEARNYTTFEQSITALGDKLIQRIGDGSDGSGSGGDDDDDSGSGRQAAAQMYFVCSMLLLVAISGLII